MTRRLISRLIAAVRGRDGLTRINSREAFWWAPTSITPRRVIAVGQALRPGESAAGARLERRRHRSEIPYPCAACLNRHFFAYSARSQPRGEHAANRGLRLLVEWDFAVGNREHVSLGGDDQDARGR